jgi:hypothetical protein
MEASVRRLTPSAAYLQASAVVGRRGGDKGDQRGAVDAAADEAPGRPERAGVGHQNGQARRARPAPPGASAKRRPDRRRPEQPRDRRGPEPERRPRRAAHDDALRELAVHNRAEATARAVRPRLDRRPRPRLLRNPRHRRRAENPQFRGCGRRGGGLECCWRLRASAGQAPPPASTDAQRPLDGQGDQPGRARRRGGPPTIPPRASPLPDHLSAQSTGMEMTVDTRHRHTVRAASPCACAGKTG